MMNNNYRLIKLLEGCLAHLNDTMHSHRCIEYRLQKQLPCSCGLDQIKQDTQEYLDDLLLRQE